MRIYDKNIIKKHIIRENPAGYHIRQISQITLDGREELLVSGCRSILVYTCEQIYLSLCDMTLIIKGSQLTMKTYFNDRIMISGEFNSIEFEV